MSPIRPEHGANDGTAKFPTHIFRHGSDEYIATNEVKEPGHIWRIELDLEEEAGSVGEYELLQYIWSAGSQPAYALKTRDGKYVVSVNVSPDCVAVTRESRLLAADMYFSPTVRKRCCSSTQVRKIQRTGSGPEDQTAST